MRALFTAKPAILWTLTSHALNMCQTLGYHRLQALKHDTPLMRQQKIWMFWTMYMTSQAVSLRLGRTSVMSDYDISVPVPQPDENTFNRFANGVVRCMHFSRIQGKIYEVLYSHSALSQPGQVRARRAIMLAEELKMLFLQIRRDQKRVRERWSHTYGVQLEIESCTSELTYYIILTLILRAIPVAPGSRTSLSPECLAAARTAFQKHAEYMPVICKSFPAEVYFKA